MDGSTASLPRPRVGGVIIALLERVWRPAAVASAALLLAVGVLALTRTGLFHVRTIDVEGTSHLSRREVVQGAGISLTTNALWLDEAAVEARLNSNPWVASADVWVDLPWTVTITVTERSPVAIVDRGGTTTLVAADGTNLGAPSPRADLPTIVAPPAWSVAPGTIPVVEVAGALGAMDERLRAEVRRATLGTTGIELVLKDGVRVVYGSGARPGPKAAAIGAVLRWADGSGERVRVINVTAPTAPTVVPVA